MTMFLTKAWGFSVPSGPSNLACPATEKKLVTYYKRAIELLWSGRKTQTLRMKMKGGYWENPGSSTS